MKIARKHKHLLTFGGVCIAAWAAGSFLFAYFWPHYVNNIYRKAILVQGFGNGPIPINTLYPEPQQIFADPIHSPAASGAPTSGSKLMTTGVNHDTLLTIGWLDLSKGPQVLHVPDFSSPDSSGRYYSVQLTDPFDVNFAYIGTRATGTQAGDYLITGPDWKGQVPRGMKQISAPDNSVLVLGRVLVYSDSDLAAAYALTKQIQLRPLNER